MSHVLIIQGEGAIALELQNILISAGATSFSFAGSHEDAIEKARLHRPDFIASEVTLLGSTGPATVKAIRAELGVIPVVYISALKADWGEGHRMTRSLQKPLLRWEIVSAFHDFCDLSPA